MSIKKYEAFLKIIETGSLSKAAKELKCTQSGITHMIKSLEDEWGFQIMTRNKAGVKLTERGRELYPLIREVVWSNDILEQTAERLRNKNTSFIRIGTFKSMAVNWLPGIIKEYQSTNPGTEIKIEDGDYDDIDRWIKNNDIDICFINMNMKLECKCIKLCDDRLLAVLPKDHRLADKKVFPVVEFEKEPVISLIDNTDQDARNVLLAAGVRPVSKLKTKDEFAMLAMVEKGLGICIMPELVLMGRMDNVKVLELSPNAKREIGLAIPSFENERIAEFAAFIDKWVRENYKPQIL